MRAIDLLKAGQLSPAMEAAARHVKSEPGNVSVIGDRATDLAEGVARSDNALSS